jgi:predicted transcriptional regulator YdeE
VFRSLGLAIFVVVAASVAGAYRVASAVPTDSTTAQNSAKKVGTMTTPHLVTVEEKKVVGIETRTTNRAESSPKTSKIGPLWGRFFAIEGTIPNKSNEKTILGVYTKYESDYMGEYSLVISSEVSSLENVPDGMVGIKIPSAKYLVFTSKGPMPASLIETWKQIWRYFSNNHEYQRAYTTDFELHDKADQTKVDIYIAVK